MAQKPPEHVKSPCGTESVNDFRGYPIAALVKSGPRHGGWLRWTEMWCTPRIIWQGEKGE